MNFYRGICCVYENTDISYVATLSGNSVKDTSDILVVKKTTVKDQKKIIKT